MRCQDLVLHVKVLFYDSQEELATIFKSVTLHEDALIQYDELDALFSQFVVNAKIKGLYFRTIDI